MMKKREPKITSGLPPPPPPLKDNTAKIAGPDW